MPKHTTNVDTKIGATVLRLVAIRGWKKLTLDDIAHAAKIPSAQMKKKFATKNDLLPCVINFITTEAVTKTGEPDLHAAPHDRLFEAMMARFDILQKFRKAVLVIIAEGKRDSAMMCRLLPALGTAMQDTLAAAGLMEGGPRQHCATMGLGLVYLATLRIWQKDETLDLAKTMAALDRHLRLAGKVADIFFRIV